MAILPLYNGSSGLYTTVNPLDIPYDSETGVGGLGAGVNVKVEKSNKISRVHGYSGIITAGAYHSGFSDGGDAFLMKGTSLYQFMPVQKTLNGVRSGMAGERVAWAQLGDRTFYSDPRFNGVIRNGVSSAWPVNSYHGEENDTDAYSKAPCAHHITFHSSRAFLVPVDAPDTICWSQSGLFGLFRRGDCYRRFDSRVIMARAVEQGIWVSSEKYIYFLRGKNPHNFQMEKKANYPAVEWSLENSLVKSSDISGVEAAGLHTLFRAKTGAVVGLATGELYNMTENRILLPTDCGGKGASILAGSFYIHSSF